jgi:hypothetical protein
MSTSSADDTSAGRLAERVSSSLPRSRSSGKLAAMAHPTPPPDGIAVVTIDRLPAWMLPTYGCAWVAMPHLDALASRGVVFDRMLATTDDSRETLRALAGGCLVDPDGHDWPLVAAAAERDRPAALATDDVAFATTPPAPADVCFVPPIATTHPAEDEATTNLGRLFAAAADLVAMGQHRLVWCHATSLGIAWDAPTNFRERYLDPDDPPPPSGTGVPGMTVGLDTDPDLIVAIRHVFAGHLSLLDACLGRLIEAITTRRGTWTILVAGVRGIGLGLHGTIGCGVLPPYDEVIRLPAVLVDHRGRMAAQRYGGLLLPDDLGETLLDQLGHKAAPSDNPWVGRSLTPLLDSWHVVDRDRIISTTPAGIAVSTPAWHLVLPRTKEGQPRHGQLFAKPDDFFERCDVADRCPAVADELATLAGAEAATAWQAPLSNEAKNGL